jgi:hypothetical protein
VLAYVFWHRPLDETETAAYEQAQIAFHRSLAHSPPVGLRGSAAFRVAEMPWLPPAAGNDAQRAHTGARTWGAGYEDWYLVEDYAALGVLNEAAVGRGHRGAHDELARRFGSGAGGLYGLIEGDWPEIGRSPGAGVPGEASVVVWVARPPGSARRELGELLGDGMDPLRSSLWRRQLVFGPAPEFCLLAPEPPAGVAPTRLPADWTATVLVREVLWSG